MLACFSQGGASVHVADKASTCSCSRRGLLLRWKHAGLLAPGAVLYSLRGRVPLRARGLPPFCNYVTDAPGWRRASNGRPRPPRHATPPCTLGGTTETAFPQRRPEVGFPRREVKAKRQGARNGKAAHAHWRDRPGFAPCAARGVKTPASAITLSRDTDPDVAVAYIRKAQGRRTYRRRLQGARPAHSGLIAHISSGAACAPLRGQAAVANNVDATFFHIESPVHYVDASSTALSIHGGGATKPSKQDPAAFACSKLQACCSMPPVSHSASVSWADGCGCSYAQSPIKIAAAEEKENFTATCSQAYRAPSRRARWARLAGASALPAKIAVANIDGVTVQVKLRKRARRQIAAAAECQFDL